MPLDSKITWFEVNYILVGLMEDVKMITRLFLMLAVLLAILAANTREASERRVERARIKKTDKARSYKALMDSMPDVVWTAEIYAATFKF